MHVHDTQNRSNCAEQYAALPASHEQEESHCIASAQNTWVMCEPWLDLHLNTMHGCSPYWCKTFSARERTCLMRDHQTRNQNVFIHWFRQRLCHDSSNYSQTLAWVYAKLHHPLNFTVGIHCDQCNLLSCHRHSLSFSFPVTEVTEVNIKYAGLRNP